MIAPGPITIVGAGPAGTLLAILLGRRGFVVNLLDRRLDPRSTPPESGRSINLALAARGIRALEHAGLMEHVRPHLIAVLGRMVHETGRAPLLLRYGQNEREVIHSVSRATLTRTLIEQAARFPNVRLRFGQVCLGAHPGDDVLRLRDRDAGATYDLPLAPTVAADGAGSAIRASLEKLGLACTREEPLEHDYKELVVPPSAGGHALDPGALHVWPRGGFMLMALPNTDGSFTATIFMPREGPGSFATLRDAASLERFFGDQFPDFVPLVPDLLAQFGEHPQGRLGTVHLDRWHVRGQVLLLGDAAHAILPFHAQGMNCAFEDCVVFDELLDCSDDWQQLFAAFERLRQPDAEAIAAIALENYLEMRERVRDPLFVRQKALALALERRFPQRFIPRYSMVMFHPEISYAEARRRGLIQQGILDTLDAAGETADSARARELIEARLPPLAAALARAPAAPLSFS